MRIATSRHPRSLAFAGTAAAGVLVVVAVAVAAIGMLAGASGPSASTATSPSAIVRLGARIPASGLSGFSWSPDGALLFVADASGGRVLDSHGRQLATFPAAEAWLDATHLIAWDGVVSDARQSRAGTSPADVRVLANGHGAAAIVTGSATCAGDPQVRWYRNGSLDATAERANPLAWSPDGADVLVGHVSCAGGESQTAAASESVPASSPSAASAPSAASPASGWQGEVQVIDFASGKVEATLPNVTGEIAFGVEPGAVAAQAGGSVEILDEGASSPVTLPGVRFLGWLDVETIFVERDGQILVADLDPPNIPEARTYERWQAAGPKGINLAADIEDNASAVLAPDGSILLDLSAAGLTAREMVSTDRPVPGEAGPIVQPGWWTPDGRRLALPAGDGTSLTLISIESAGSTAS